MFPYGFNLWNFYTVTNDVPGVLGAQIRGCTVHKFLFKCNSCFHISLQSGKETGDKKDVMNLKKWIEFRQYLEDISKGLYGHLGRDDGWKWWEIYEKVFLNGLDQAWILQDSHRMTEKIASWSEIRDGKKLEQRGWKERVFQDEIHQNKAKQ